jgi:dephospho-CoA kinase
MRQQRIIGLTGGIGGGKSTVARIARIFGIPVFDADAAAKSLYFQYPALREEVAHAFGPDLFVGDELQRAVLASRIFETDGGKEKIAALIHPYLQKEFTAWCAAHANHSWVMKEAAILIESGNSEACTSIVQVVAPESLRIQRVMQRNGWSEKEIRLRMAAQMTDEQRTPHCDYTIVNDDRTALLPQFIAMWNAIAD